MRGGPTPTGGTQEPSRIAVIGGGMMGIAFAYESALRGHRVVLYEKEDRLGGLSTWEDFGPFTWDRFYHCILPTDSDLLGFIEELGLADELAWSQTSTGVHIDGKTYPLDTVGDFMRFSALSLWERFRLGLTVLRCALVRDVQGLEGITAEEWFIRVGGERPYWRIWRPLLRAKFGEAADSVSPVFLVAKVKRMLTARSDISGRENLGYVRGGYRALLERAHDRLVEMGVEVLSSCPVEALSRTADGGVTVTSPAGSRVFDRVVVTLPFKEARRLAADWTAPHPVPRTAAVEYMALVCLVAALKRKVVKHYVLNLADDDHPFTGVIGMSDLVDTSETAGYELVYVPKYVRQHDPLLEASDDEVFARFFRGLKDLYPDLSEDDIAHWYVRRATVVQPIQGIEYSMHAPRPDFSQPVIVVNNAQLLESDLHNSEVVRHARAAADTLDSVMRQQETPATARQTPREGRSHARVRVVLPAYNEADSIFELLGRTASVLEDEGLDFSIIVVDDGSSDGTADEVARAPDSWHVTLVRHDANKGLGQAIQTGLRAALKRSDDDDVVVTLDADLTQDPKYIPRMLEKYREGADVVIASRYRRGSRVLGVSRLRKFLTWGARLFYGTLVHIEGVRDYSCGFRLYRAGTLRAAYERLGDDFVTEDGFAVMVEIAGKLRHLARFAEVPFILRYDEKRTASKMVVLPTVLKYLSVIRHIWQMEITGRLGPDDRPFDPRLGYAFLGGVVVFSVTGQVLLKMGADAAASGADGLVTLLAGAATQPAVWLGLLAYSVSTALWLLTLAQMNLSVAYPVGSLAYVLTVVAGALMGETVPPLRWLGALFIVAGVALVGLGFERGPEGEPS